VILRSHHCRWVSNCVGYGNLKLFVLFTCYGSIVFLLNCLVLLQNFYFTNQHQPDGIQSWSHIFTHKFDIENIWYGKPLAIVDDLLISSSWGLGCYTLFLAFDAGTKVLLDRAHTDNSQPRKYNQLRKEYHRSRGFLQSIEIIFGEDLTLFWLPVAARRAN
jgi:hypothetical protein